MTRGTFRPTFRNMPVQTDVRFSLVLPEEIYNQYPSEEEMAARLKACVTYNAKSPLYFTDQQRNELSQILGRLIKTPAELISILKQKHEIKVGSVKVPLDDQLVARLETRCFGLSLEDLIKKQVVECLEQFVGMR